MMYFRVNQYWIFGPCEILIFDRNDGAQAAESSQTSSIDLTSPRHPHPTPALFEGRSVFQNSSWKTRLLT